MAKKQTLMSVAVGAAFAAGLAAPVAYAAENPFAMQSLERGYQVADAHKHGEGKCGAEGKCGHSKTKDGKCGEGKCGSHEKKAGEGKCGGDKKATEGKATEGKCGEGKCGGKKPAEAKCGAAK